MWIGFGALMFWAFVAKDENETLIASSALAMVIGCDRVMREKVAELIDMKTDYKAALEAAMADADMRALNLTT